jgi:hypothetical protein
MPVKRRVPKRRREVQRDWAKRLLAGVRPEQDGSDWPADLDWLYFGEAIPGLPASRSAEGQRCWARARSAA